MEQTNGVVLNVLLMLSRERRPDPELEVRWHIERSRQSVTYLASPQAVKLLKPGESTVVLYGDKSLGNRILGLGRFQGREDKNNKRGLGIARAQADLYVRGTLDSAASWVGMKPVVAARTGLTLESLSGIIASEGARNGRPLALDSLDESQARACVYFTTTALIPIE